jgi:hypothetical protein
MALNLNASGTAGPVFPAVAGKSAEKDGILETFERAEKCVVAASFLAAKIISVIALMIVLTLLGVGVLKRAWEIGFSVMTPSTIHTTLSDTDPPDKTSLGGTGHYGHDETSSLESDSQ